jgi:hypothetical protein
MSITRQQYIDGMRAYLNYLEAHEDAPYQSWGLSLFQFSHDDFLRAAKGLMHGGTLKKKITECNVAVIRMFGDLPVKVYADSKTVCTLVQPAVYEYPKPLLEELKNLEDE